jgi:HEAT repeat protein
MARAKILEREFESALSLIRAGGVSEATLVLLYGSADDFGKSRIAAAIGRAPGSSGLQLLRDLAGDSAQPADARCAAVHSLASRLGPDASDTLRARLRDRDENVRGQALLALAAFGTDVAWAEIYDDLAKSLPSQVPTPYGLQWETLAHQSRILPMVCYLGRHLGAPQQRAMVAETIRSNWSHLYAPEQRWFDEYWPECGPGNSLTGSSGPNPEILSAWIRKPFFESN